MTQASRPVAQTVAAIQSLDLGPIKLKLMDPEEGQGWSREYAEQMAVAYKRFLTLLVKFPEETIAPTKDVDKFWHGHILDTIKYAEDCENVFGYFLHHFPYFGMRGEQDAADLRAASERMHEIYEREFGEALPTGAAWCTAAKAAQSGTAWCTAAKPAQTDTAWCTVGKPAQAKTAWCTAAKPTQTHTAWCTAATPLVKSSSAWCTAARSSAAG
jgi:hypothetical protein